MRNHTPGPWHYQQNADAYTHIVRGPNNEYICGFSQHASGRAKADAHLAALAPDLLSVVRSLTKDGPPRDEHGCIHGDWACRECKPYSHMLVEGFKCSYHRALELIALAEPKEPHAE